MFDKYFFLKKITPFVLKFYPEISFWIRSICMCITLKCNLKCKMCGAQQEKWEMYKENLDEDMSFENFQNIIISLKKFKTNIILTGGEPLLHKEWFKFAKFAKENNLCVTLQTNGVFLEENVERILEVFNQINVSIDGVEKIHDDIRGKRGTYEKIIKGLKLLKNIRREKNLYSPGLNIWFTITPWNYKFLKDTFIELANLEIGMDNFTVVHPMFIKEEAYRRFRKIFPTNGIDIIKGFLIDLSGIDTEYIRKEIKEIKKLIKKYKNIKIIFSPQIDEKDISIFYNREKDFLSKSLKCLTPWLDPFILPDGSLFSCMGIYLGNTKNENIINLWNNKRAKYFRRKFLEEGPFPICKNCCFRRI